MWWKSQAQLTYEFDTAILQTNRLLSREAHAILYSDNLLVLLEFNTDNHAFIAYTKLRKDIAYKLIPKGISLPSNAVHITHQRHPRYSSRGKTSLILAANDFPAVCNFIADCALIHMTKDIYTINTLPPGCRTHNRLSELVWDPLKALREIRSIGTERQVIKAVDSTGFFEVTDEMSDWEQEGEEEYFTDYWYDDETTDASSDNEVDMDGE
ncbi:hypothetical protein MMC28_005535 [Mycoblastus sanguinarius]|nr:hypothetical protein [Mycoblastus sanguinarius]